VPDFAPGTEVSSQETTGTINVSYDWTADVMTYASASRGFKGGGFNLERTAAVVTAFDPTVAGDPSFDGETATSYEFGVRSTLLDGRVTLNATAFHTKFDDFQILNFSGLQFFIYNVDEVTTQGVELEGVYRATENLTLSGGATYLEAEYGEDNEPIPGLPLLPGNELTAAPELTLTGAVSYDRDIPGTDLRGMANFNVRYQTEQYLNSSLKPQTRQDAYAVANARIGIGSSDDRWAVELFATNLFDEDYSILINDAPLQSGSFNRNPADPRVVGVSLKLRH
jgi:outer membrane receptor protein involved in Fe transport